MPDPKSSRLPGFYRLTIDERRDALRTFGGLPDEGLAAFDPTALDLDAADLMIENVVGGLTLPLGVGINFRVNGKDVVVPMAVEEPSVVAAASNMARIVRRSGGFVADADHSVMIGQVQLVDVADPDAVVSRLEAARTELLDRCKGIHPELEKYGGGIRGVEFRSLRYDERGERPENMVVVHFFLDCVDAMGANMVNTVAERLAPTVARISGEQVGLRILSNLASRRLARASCAIPVEDLDMPGASGVEVAAGIAAAYRFAWVDPWRAATHNKGIMNGIDPVVIATGNDWRAIEAGAHAWAARDGTYRSLTRWVVRGGDGGDVLHGSIELPLQVGVVGGTIRNHPTVRANLQLLGEPGARELAAILAAVGLAQNLGALRALATEGIQRGHMRMHARSIAVQAGARNDEVEAVVSELVDGGEFSLQRAAAALVALRG